MFPDKFFCFSQSVSIKLYTCFFWSKFAAAKGYQQRFDSSWCIFWACCAARRIIKMLAHGTRRVTYTQTSSSAILYLYLRTSIDLNFLCVVVFVSIFCTPWEMHNDFKTARLQCKGGRRRRKVLIQSLNPKKCIQNDIKWHRTICFGVWIKSLHLKKNPHLIREDHFEMWKNCIDISF